MLFLSDVLHILVSCLYVRLLMETFRFDPFWLIDFECNWLLSSRVVARLTAVLNDFFWFKICSVFTAMCIMIGIKCLG